MNPNYNKDIDLGEGVQHRATMLITGMQNLSYDDTVKRLGLMRLNTRRLRSDLKYFSNLMMATKEDIAKNCLKEGVD